MAKNTFISNNTFVGYLHSRSVVQYFHLDLQDNMHLFFAMPRNFLNIKSLGTNGLNLTLASYSCLSLC